MSRWVRIQTDVFDHAVFACEPFSEREAWLWLISKAAWKATKHRVGHVVVDVPVGSMFLTLREMQATWRWKSDKRVRSFLTMLENEEMIETKTDAGKTQISICNYSRYQDVERKEDAERTQAGRTEDALKTPIHQDTNSEAKASSPKVRANGLEGFKSILLEPLGAERLEAFIATRRAKHAAFTGHAANLFLADAASVGMTPAAAADTCISRNWITVKPEYLTGRSAPQRQSTSPPPKPHNAGELSYQQLMDQIDEYPDQHDRRLEPRNGNGEAENIGGFQKFAVSGDFLRRM